MEIEFLFPLIFYIFPGKTSYPLLKDCITISKNLPLNFRDKTLLRMKKYTYLSGFSRCTLLNSFHR